jgi:hypothetical protein
VQSATDESPAIHRRKTTPTRTVLGLGEIPARTDDPVIATELKATIFRNATNPKGSTSMVALRSAIAS